MKVWERGGFLLPLFSLTRGIDGQNISTIGIMNGSVWIRNKLNIWECEFNPSRQVSSVQGCSRPDSICACVCFLGSVTFRCCHEYNKENLLHFENLYKFTVLTVKTVHLLLKKLQIFHKCKEREGILIFFICPVGHNIWWENHWNGFLDATASPCTYVTPVGGSVGDSFRFHR